MSNTVLELAKLVARQGQIMNIMTAAIADQTSLLVDLLPRCTRTGCTAPATVSHKSITAARFCDQCAARSIVSAAERQRAEPENGTVGELRATITSVDDWIDLPKAEQTRRLVAYSEALNKIDQVDVSVH